MDNVEFRKPAWIVFGLHKSGNLVIHAIDTDNSLANDHRKMLQADIDNELGTSIKVWIEKTELNHLFVWEINDY